MADIKQAAEWLREGKLVRRPYLDKHFSLEASQSTFFPRWIMVCEGGHFTADKRHAPFTVEDFLADDWEIAEETR